MAMMGTGVSTGENRAREAAEAAIASPLLEDVDFHGAKGVLVNITAGMDMSIGEFEIVGEAIKSFASESATVVVGTVIDPELTDELRVTVVVTGLGVGNRDFAGGAASNSALSRPARIIRTDVAPDYNQLERPAYLRNQDAVKQPQPVSVSSVEEPRHQKESDYLDIPAFLRKQEE